MNKRKGFLEELKNNDGVAFEKITIIMQRYYKIYDLDLGTVYGKVFYMLYISDMQFTFDDICQATGIGMTTLKMYRKRYDELAAKIIAKGVID